MRPLLLLLVAAGALLPCACDQDYAASNADRHSFMGAVHAAPLPSATAPETLPPPALPTTAAVPTAAPSASAAPAGSASARPAPSAAPAPAGSAHH